jgi:hypothetical protein
LITSGRRNGHQRQAERLGADVVEGDPPADVAGPADAPDQLGGPLQQVALGDLEDHLHVRRRQVRQLGQPPRTQGRQRRGLDVDEHRHVPGDLLEAPQRCPQAHLVELVDRSGRPRGGEQALGGVRGLRPPRASASTATSDRSRRSTIGW